MDRLAIQGGKKLSGEVAASGAKNSILPIMFSTLLAEGEHVFHNVPNLKDVESACKLLNLLNCECHLQDGTLRIKVGKTKSPEADYDVVRKMRASILCLGPLLSKYKQAIVSLPGGCAIGTRPINLHLEAMRALGAEIDIEAGYVKAKTNSLKGGEFTFDAVTVGGTENMMMAAVLADGETIINNAAKEPEIDDLAAYLNKMGAQISGAGTSTIRIRGVGSLKPSEHFVIPDRIEVGTLLLAGAVTGGDITIKNCRPDHIGALIQKLKTAGFKLRIEDSSIAISANNSIKPVDMTTEVYPGFATDLQAQFMVLATIADGTSVITETIFENRFMHVQELVRMNADITHKNREAIVRGKPGCLIGAPVMATDLRASACLVLAGLAARGETLVNRIYHLDRGYERLEEKLSSLGGSIKRF